MQIDLFNKYDKEIKNRNDKKTYIINKIKEETGIVLENQNIEIEKEKIKIFISSAQKYKIKISNIKNKLEQEGFNLIF